jgi:hypothetical protein
VWEGYGLGGEGEWRKNLRAEEATGRMAARGTALRMRVVYAEPLGAELKANAWLNIVGEDRIEVRERD